MHARATARACERAEIGGYGDVLFLDTREGHGPSVLATRARRVRRRPVLDTREGNGPSVSASGGSLEPDAWGWGPPRVRKAPHESKKMTALITRASSGIGLELARGFARHRHHVL